MLRVMNVNGTSHMNIRIHTFYHDVFEFVPVQMLSFKTIFSLVLVLNE